jgi:hypothetical protein
MKIKYNETIYQEAVAKVKQQNKIKEYENTCLEASICPNCGNDLYSDMDWHGFTDIACSSCKYVKYIT